MNSVKTAIILTLVLPQIVFARADDCSIRGKSAAAQSDEVKAAALMGEENRLKLDQFANQETPLEQLKKAFAASGGLNCPYGDGSAQITVANNVMTTAAHMFYDENCKKRDGADQCYFFKPDEPNTKYFVDLPTLKVGMDAPGGECFTKQRYFDWAVVKLKTAVDGVTPYHVPGSDGTVQVGKSMVMVSTGDDNFNQGGQNIQLCETKAMWNYENVPIQTNCDTGAGASGAGQFQLENGKLSLDPAKLILTSIHVSEGPRAKDGKVYNDKDQYNTSVPVETDFLAAIKALAGQ